MKRTLALLLAACCLLTCVLAEEESFLSVTGLGEMQAKLAEGEAVVSVLYSDGYGFSDSGFSTEDASECAALFEALARTELVGKTDQSVTDWYPLVLFTLSDGSRFGVRFEGAWLDRGTDGNWEVRGAEPFWELTAELTRKYAGEQTSDAWVETEPLPNAVDLYFPGSGWTYSLSEGTVISVESMFMQDSGRTWFRFRGECEGGEAVTIARGEHEGALFYLRVDEKNNVLIWGVEMAE